MYDYSDLGNFFVVFLSLCGVISIVGGAYMTIKQLRKPRDDFHEQVNKHEEYLQSDHERLNAMEEDNKILCKGILVLINHEITGNDISNMRKIRDELQQHLIER